MFEAQRLMDLQDNPNFGDPKSWLSGDNDNNNININSSPTHLPTTHSSLAPTPTGSNVDRVLFKDLVEIVPLVQSLIDRKASSSFTRRGSMIYTKTPSRESLSKKITEPKGRNATQSIPTKKRRDPGDKDHSKNASNNFDAESFSSFSSRASAAEKDREELVMLKEQVEDLQKKILEKDELLKSAEISKNQMNAVQVKLDELKQQAEEKDSLIKSTQRKLSDAKIKLADKQAALEKIQWEAMTSNREVEKLQEDLDSLRGEISSFMLLFESLTKNDSATHTADYDITPNYLDSLSHVDNLDEMEIQRMEEARQAYIAAVAAAKEKQDEESITAAANARLFLQSLVISSERKC